MAHKNSINMTNLQREGSSGEGEGGGKEEIAVKRRRRRAGDKRGSARLQGDCQCVCLCCPLGHCLAHVRAYCFCCLLLGSALIVRVGYKFYHYQRRKINLCAALWICVNLHNATNTRTNKIRTRTHTHILSEIFAICCWNVFHSILLCVLVFFCCGCCCLL